MVHVFPHWNKEGLTIDQGVTEVRIFSNCHTVELFLNGKSFGKKKKMIKMAYLGVFLMNQVV
ncbi:MAG: DUF4982 domain-containing protein [Enterococcus casseliflavus]